MRLLSSAYPSSYGGGSTLDRARRGSTHNCRRLAKRHHDYRGHGWLDKIGSTFPAPDHLIGNSFLLNPKNNGGPVTQRKRLLTAGRLAQVFRQKSRACSLVKLNSFWPYRNTKWLYREEEGIAKVMYSR